MEIAIGVLPAGKEASSNKRVILQFVRAFWGAAIVFMEVRIEIG
jgi:hypothetical protein